MALSNLFGWKKSETEAAAASDVYKRQADKPAEKPAACGTACGAADKPEGSNRPGDDCFERTGAERRQPAACGTACGAADKPAEKPAACGTACGASDK